MKNVSKSYPIQDLCKLVNGKLIGDTNQQISEPEQIESAKESSITFIGHKKYIPLWEKSNASAAIIDRSLHLTDPGPNKAFIEVDNADLAMAQLLELFTPSPVKLAQGIHPSAIVDKTAFINDIPDGKTILGFPAVEAKDTLKQWAIIRRLAKKG